MSGAAGAAIPIWPMLPRPIQRSRRRSGAPFAPTFYKDKIVCDQSWSKSALGEEVLAWLQVTFTVTYDILDDSLPSSNLSTFPMPTPCSFRTKKCLNSPPLPIVVPLLHSTPAAVKLSLSQTTEHNFFTMCKKPC